LLSSRIPAVRNQTLISLAMFVLAIWVAYEAGGKIIAGDLRTLEFAAIGFAACAVGVAILRNWRSGFYIFLVWLMFEDLVRKYMGNSTMLFFGKDVLAGLVYVSLYVAIRRRREKSFRPPFLFLLGLFVWLGVLQVFNQNSPSILYGLLGFKLYFYYIPLLWVGYALIRRDEDLRKFLVANSAVAGLIGGVGVAQAIIGNSFLNPAHLAPELQDLGDLYKVTPLSGQILSLPDSVFVSAGRFGNYLLIAIILVVATAGYLVLNSASGRKLALGAIAIVGGAALLSGSRGAVLLVAASALVLAAGFLWGAPWRKRQAYRMVKAIRQSCIVGALGLAAILLIFPNQAGSRIAYYSETLSPDSPYYQLEDRTIDYPLKNLEGAFSGPHWIVGNGLGTASLGTQYVSKLLGQPPPYLWVEDGLGDIIIEMGIFAPILWLLWAGALLLYSWKVVRRLRESRLYPVAFAIFWYAFLLLIPLTYSSLATYQNYICNAYLWLLVGILFRLPDLLASPLVPEAISSRHVRDIGGLDF
jgi:hypothetical protein